MTNRALRSEVLRIFDGTFAITWALEVVAIAVAVMGIVATLITVIDERRRELAVLRLAGASRGQVQRMIVAEAAILGAIGQALGLIAGLALSIVLVDVINVQSFGWSIQFHAPFLFLLQLTTGADRRDRAGRRDSSAARGPHVSDGADRRCVGCDRLAYRCAALRRLSALAAAVLVVLMVASAIRAMPVASTRGTSGRSSRLTARSRCRPIMSVIPTTRSSGGTTPAISTRAKAGASAIR